MRNARNVSIRAIVTSQGLRTYHSPFDPGGPVSIVTPLVRQWIEEGLTHPDDFWARAARELPWFRPWDQVFEWNFPTFRWFVGGETNLAFNALDRHVINRRGDHTALVYMNERGERRRFSYRDLLALVEQIA